MMQGWAQLLRECTATAALWEYLRLYRDALVDPSQATVVRSEATMRSSTGTRTAQTKMLFTHNKCNALKERIRPAAIR
jgi:hypothetical protein